HRRGGRAPGTHPVPDPRLRHHRRPAPLPRLPRARHGRTGRVRDTLTGEHGTAPYLRLPGPLALAHRGGGAEVPENSHAALEHAAGLGYQYIETDLHRTADDVVVLLHDPTVDRTTD